MKKEQTKSSTKITKVSLVIYCSILFACLIAFITTSVVTKDYGYLYGYLLCLGPGLLFTFISFFFPTSKLVEAKVGKGYIAWFVITCVIKYAAIIGIPFIGLKWNQYFNKWVMLGTTLISPIFVYIYKLLFANIVSKYPKNSVK